MGKTVLLTTIAGLAGGVLASGLLLLLGVSVDRIGLEYLWMIALLLMLFRQRFLCFGYSGGVLAMLHYMIGRPDMDSSQLLAMVAVLHFTEAFLVLTTGHLNALPIYLQNDRRNVVGGFVLQMIWPLPLVMLSALYSGTTVPQAGFLLLPDWWPVLRHPQSACAAAGFLCCCLCWQLWVIVIWLSVAVSNKRPDNLLCCCCCTVQFCCCWYYGPNLYLRCRLFLLFLRLLAMKR